MQMEKVFYSDHYYIDLLWDIEEKLVKDESGNQCLRTTLELKTCLKFVKSVNLIQNKVKDYYNSTLIENFNYYLKPRLEAWI
jgi:hypothetical protein